jgi:hypothetical protein
MIVLMVLSLPKEGRSHETEKQLRELVADQISVFILPPIFGGGGIQGLPQKVRLSKRFKFQNQVWDVGSVRRAQHVFCYAEHLQLP